MLRTLSYCVLLAACAPDAEEMEPDFECADVGGTATCDDFNAGDSASWRPEGGSWSVIEGRYVGVGPETVDPAQCGASLMTASLRDGSEAVDLAFHAEIDAEARLDKTIVLRARDSANRIELNFRGAPLNDLIVQELVDCEVAYFTAEGEVPVAQPEGAPVVIDVELRGDHLFVRADGAPVLDGEFDFANAGEGRVGLAVIDHAITSFDDVWMRRL
jgi:hypothetical protein